MLWQHTWLMEMIWVHALLVIQTGKIQRPKITLSPESMYIRIRIRVTLLQRSIYLVME